MIGGARNDQDRALVERLRDEARQLGVSDHVAFEVNASFSALLDVVERAKVAIHTMQEEHFGISVVELIAAGCVVVAHNSGGPKEDIVGPHEFGFLASTADEFAGAIGQAFYRWESTSLQTMRQRGRRGMRMFDDEVFIDGFLQVLSHNN